MAEQMNQGSEARQRAEQVAGSAADEARAVEEDAREQASAVASEVSHHAQDLVGEARQALEDQAREQAHRLAGTIEDLGNKLRALASGDAEQAGELRGYVDDLGQRVRGAGERLESRGLDGMVDDVQQFARRRPTMFLASAAAAGFLVGRMVRGERDAGGNGQAAPAPPPEVPEAVPAGGPPAQEPVYGGATAAGIAAPQPADETVYQPPTPPGSGGPR